MEGLAQLIRTVNMVKERLNPGLAVEGILFTMFDGRTSLAAQVKPRFTASGGPDLYNRDPTECSADRGAEPWPPVFLYDLKSSGAIAYLELTKEVLAHG